MTNSKNVMRFYVNGQLAYWERPESREQYEQDFKEWLRDTLIEYGRTLEQYWEPDIEEQADNLIKRELS